MALPAGAADAAAGPADIADIADTADTGGAGAQAPRGRRPRLSSSPELFAFLFLMLICLLLALSKPVFLSELNLQDIGRQTSVLLVLSVGLLVVLLSGGIDLSVSGMVAFSGVIAALAADHMPLTWAFVLAVLASTMVGVVNGVLVGVAGFSPIIVTLAVGQVLAGAALLLTVSGPIEPANPRYGSLATASLGPVPTIIIAALACVLLAQVILGS